MVDTSLVFDLIARDRASATIKGVGTEAGRTTSKMDKFHKVGKAAGVALGVGLLGAGKAAIEFTKRAAEDQQSASRMAQTFHKAAGATGAQIASTERWITAQGKAKGVADDELRPALSKLVVATGSVAKAQHLASLAMDVSQGTGKSLTSVSFALAKAQGGNVSGLARLGVQTTKTTKDTAALEKAQTASKSAAVAYTAAVKAHGKNSIEASIAEDKLKQANDNVRIASTATKKETLSLDQITKNLASTYGGAASKNAETAAGKQKILEVQMSELQEKIGYALIPALSALVGVGTTVINWIDHNTTTAGVLVGVLGGLLAVTWAVSAATKVWAATTTIANVATKAWAAGQWLLNAALTANPIGLVVVAIAALVVGLVIAYKKSETFRAIVTGAFHGVQAAAAKVFGWLKGAVAATIGFVKAHWMLIVGILGGPVVLAAALVIKNWGRIKAAFSSAVSSVLGFVRSHWQALVAIIGGPLGIVVGLVIKHWSAIRSATSNTIGAVVGFFKGLPGRITSAIGNLGSLLYNAGASIIQGLIDGVTSKIGALTSKLHFITNLIPFHKGPIERDRLLLKPAGEAIMEGLMHGLDKGWVKVRTALERVTGYIANQRDKVNSLLSAKADFASGFQSFTSSVFSADLSHTVTGPDGDTTTPGSVKDILAYQAAQQHKAAGLRADVKRLHRLGLSNSLIKQLQASGESGMAQIHTLAGASRAQIKQLNASDKATHRNLAAAGGIAGGQLYNSRISDARRNEDLAERIAKKLRDALEHAKKGEELVIRDANGNWLIKAIRKEKRAHGQGSNV